MSGIDTLIGGALGAIGGLFGGGKPKSQTQTTQYSPYNTGVYAYTDPERDYTAGMSMDMLDNLYGQWGPGGMGGGGGYGHANAGGAGSNGGGPSQWDIAQTDANDWTYQATAPEPWMQDITSRGKEYLNSQAENDIRGMTDSSIRSGLSPDSPAFQWMVTQRRRQAGEQTAGVLRDAEIAWTLPAAQRRAGVLEGNTGQLNSGRSDNAHLDEAFKQRVMSASQAYAGRKASASAANAGFAGANAQLDLARMGMLWDMQQDIQKPVDHLQMLPTSQTSSGGGGGGGLQGMLGGAMLGAQVGNQFGGGGGGSYQGDPNFGQGGDNYGVGFLGDGGYGAENNYGVGNWWD